jgi:hypothetical protein
MKNIDKDKQLYIDLLKEGLFPDWAYIDEKGVFHAKVNDKEYLGMNTNDLIKEITLCQQKKK